MPKHNNKTGKTMKKMNFKSRAKSAGFSLIELLLVIGFIAGALVLAFVTYPKVQATNRANLESQHLTVLASGIKNLYSTTKNFSSLNNETLINSKIIPDDMPANGTAIGNVWGGDVTIASEAGSNDLRYRITYTGVPKAECVKLATGVSTNFVRATINDSTVILDRMNNSQVDIDPAAITTACADDSTNTMEFIGN